jgi:prepilin-type processing-associated H-X9-DG protein
VFLGALVVTIFLLSTSLARGQSSAALLVKPWEASETHEDQTALYLFADGHVHDAQHSFDLTTFESQGRVRIMPGHEASPRIGYDVTYLNTKTSEPGFPGQLLDASVAAGTFLSQTNGWVTGLTLGVGYAGQSPFAVGRGWYGRADFVIAKKFSEIDAIGIGLDYDGNRTYAPDIPLPGFGWSHQFDPTIVMVIGLPVTSIEWKPIPHLIISADYVALSAFDFDVGYEFVRHWTAFTAFESRQDAFWIDELPGDKRLLYSQRRVEAGIRFQPKPFITFSLAGGWSYYTEFRSGFDSRKTSRVFNVSDEPFLRLGLQLEF